MSIKPLLRLAIYFLSIISITASYASPVFQGSIQPIPKELQKTITGNTWRKDCPVSIKDLSYLKISYWGFDNQVHQGEMIVHQKVAEEVIDIFRQLFKAHSPIQQIEIPERLPGSQKYIQPFDLLLYAINSNDTYGFFCREDTQTPGKFSEHSWGLAMDINPFYNPMAGNENIAKMQKGNQYLNRNLHHIGMIRAEDPIFNIFTEHGWQWGGFFTKGADYMHFEKLVRPRYMIERLKYVPDSEQIANLELLK